MPGRRRTRSASNTAFDYLGWIGHRNLGDEALFDALGLAFAQRASLHPVADKQPSRLRRRRRRRSDAVLLGGGTLIGGKTLNDLERVQHLPLVVFGSGVLDPEFWDQHPERGVDLKPWIPLLDDAPFLGVRGPMSAKVLADHGLPNVEVLGDPICHFVRDQAPWQPSGRRLGINIGTALGQQWGAEQDLCLSLAKAVRSLAGTGWSIEFFVVWPDDIPATRSVMERAGVASAPVHMVYEDVHEYMDLCSGLTAFIGTKLHAVAIAMCAGVPSAMVEYRPKCRDFMASIGALEWSIRLDKADTDWFIDMAERLALTPDRSGAQTRALVRHRELQRQQAPEVLTRLLEAHRGR